MPDLSRILEDLYGGTLDDATWDRALVSIADLVRGSASYVFAFNPTTGQVLRDENHRGDPKVLDDYRAYWSYHDCRLPAFLELPVGRAATETTLLQISQWRRAPLLNEFLLPADSPHFMPVWLHRADSKAVTLSIQGTRRRGPFEAADVEALQQLAPHLARALAIRDRLESLRVRADTLATTLNRVNFGILILDSMGCILESNTVAEQLLRSDSGMCRKSDGTFWLRGPPGVELSHWMLAGRVPSSNANGLWRIPRPLAGPLSVVATPLQPTLVTSWLRRDPRWMVLVFDPEVEMQVSSSLIRCNLGISTREAEISALLVAGCNLRDIAARLRISVHTARNHLKAIFRKTGLRSQSELIRRLASSSVIFAPGGGLCGASHTGPPDARSPH